MTKYSFSDELKARIKANVNALVGVVGTPGSGKSYASLTISEKVDPDFTIDKVCFSLEEFNNLINTKPPKGSCLILDEAGVSQNTRTWYSLQNRLMNYILITFRSSCLVTFFNLPSLKMLDNQARSLLHYVLEPTSINRAYNVSTLKLMRLQQNPILGRVYSKYPWVNDEGQISQVQSLKCPLPSLKLRRAYEKKKQEFRDELGTSIANELKAEKIKGDQNKPTDFTDIVEEILRERSSFETTFHNRTFIDKEIIRARYPVGIASARKIKKMVEMRIKEQEEREI